VNPFERKDFDIRMNGRVRLVFRIWALRLSGKKSSCFLLCGEIKGSKLSFGYAGYNTVLVPLLMVQETSYVLGEDIEDAGFYVGDKQVQLMDFASIPVVTKITIVRFNIKIKNTKGIRVIEIFTALAKKWELIVHILFAFLITDLRFTGRTGERLGDHQ
jgi:hypothetical protein